MDVLSKERKRCSILELYCYMQRKITLLTLNNCIVWQCILCKSCCPLYVVLINIRFKKTYCVWITRLNPGLDPLQSTILQNVAQCLVDGLSIFVIMCLVMISYQLVCSLIDIQWINIYAAVKSSHDANGHYTAYTSTPLRWLVLLVS